MDTSTSANQIGEFTHFESKTPMMFSLSARLVLICEAVDDLDLFFTFHFIWFDLI